MNKYIFATIVALISIFASFIAFGQSGPHEAQGARESERTTPTIEHEGETFEIVTPTLSDLHLSQKDKMQDVLKMGQYLGFRPFTKETRDKLDPGTMRFAQQGNAIIAREPFTNGKTQVLYVESLYQQASSLIPIGDTDRGAYANIKWFYRDGDTFLFLRAVHN